MITVISGTDRNNSVTLQVAQLYVDVLSEMGHQAQILDLTQVPVQCVSASAYGVSTPQFRLIETGYFRSPSRLIFVVPEYNGSIPGYLKYVIDACDHKVFSGKRCALVGVASGRGGNLRGLEHLTGILHYLGAEVFSRKVYLSQVNNTLANGGLQNNEVTQREVRAQLAGFFTF